MSRAPVASSYRPKPTLADLFSCCNTTLPPSFGVYSTRCPALHGADLQYFPHRNGFMSRIISVHSFRGGTGKSNTTANLTALLANQGQRVGVVDTDIQSPGIHALFGLDEENMTYSLNDYLNGKCDIQQAAHDVTNTLGAPILGKIFLVPSSIKTGEIMRVLKDGVDPGLLNDGFHNLIEELRLDTLMIDTHPGLNEETMLSIA